MKTIIIMLSLLGLFYLLPSYAQTFRMGIAGGMNISSTDCSESKAGFRAGVTGEYSFKDPSNGLFLSVGMLLAHQPYKGKEYFYQEVNATKRWDATPFYLSIPLHVGYKMPCGKNVNVFASAGPYLGIGLFGKEKCFTEDITGKQIEEERKQSAEMMQQLQELREQLAKQQEGLLTVDPAPPKDNKRGPIITEDIENKDENTTSDVGSEA